MRLLVHGQPLSPQEALAMPKNHAPCCKESCSLSHSKYFMPPSLYANYAETFLLTSHSTMFLLYINELRCTSSRSPPIIVSSSTLSHNHRYLLHSYTLSLHLNHPPHQLHQCTIVGRPRSPPNYYIRPPCKPHLQAKTLPTHFHG